MKYENHAHVGTHGATFKYIDRPPSLVPQYGESGQHQFLWVTSPLHRQMRKSKNTVVPDATEAKRLVEKLFSDKKITRRLSEANEATTRIELIDAVLRAVGWPDEELNREVPSGTGDSLDYELQGGGLPWMVVEAKRAGKTFDLDKSNIATNDSAGRSIKLLLSRGGSTLREALKQAAQYCNDRAIPLACITNGYQWVFFRGLSSKHRKWQDGSALIFSDAKDVISRFDDFWGCISRAWAGKPYLNEFLDRPPMAPLPAPRTPRDFLEIRRPASESEVIAVLRLIDPLISSERANKRT